MTRQLQKSWQTIPEMPHTHKDSQNEIFHKMVDMVRSEISTEMKEAEHFALMVDKSKDISKSEQISIVVRYLRGKELREEFLHFTQQMAWMPTCS